MDAPAETPCPETDALLAVMNEDPTSARKLIDQMLPGERAIFFHRLAALEEIVGEYLAQETGTVSRAGRHRRM